MSHRGNRGRGRGGNRRNDHRGGNRQGGNRRGGNRHDDQNHHEPPSPLAREVGQIVSLMVEAPERVRVYEQRHNHGSSFKVRLAESDLGKVIGRQGRTARALRTLLTSRGEEDGYDYGLEIREW